LGARSGIGRRFVEGYPEIYVVSNVMVNGEPIGSLARAKRRGTPTSRTWKITKASMLFALEIPPAAATRIFAGCIMPTIRFPTTETPPQRTPAQARWHYNSGGYVRQGVPPSTIQ